MTIIYVLDVGDDTDDSFSAIIKHNSSRLTVIDCSNWGKENTTDFIIENLEREEVWRFILTHPDMDHMSGLHELSTTLTVHNFWDTGNNKKLRKGDFDYTRWNYEDWAEYQRIRTGQTGTHVHMINRRGFEGKYWTNDGISFLSPTKPLINSANDNPNTNYHDLSYVIMYVGPKPECVSILFMGEASLKAQDDLIKKEVNIEADVLVAPHHGSKNNFKKELVERVDPTYVIVPSASRNKTDFMDYWPYVGFEKLLVTAVNGTIRIAVRGDGYGVSTDYE